MAIGDVVQIKSLGDTFDSPVTAGNTVIYFSMFWSYSGYPETVTESLSSGELSKAIEIPQGDADGRSYYIHSIPIESSGNLTISSVDDVGDPITPPREHLIEVEGHFTPTALSEQFVDDSPTDAGSVSVPTISADNGTISIGIAQTGANGNVYTPTDSTWDKYFEATYIEAAVRKNSAEVVDFSGTRTAVATTDRVAAGFVIYEPLSTTPSLRKGSTFDIETTLSGTVTSATLNGQAITVDSQAGTTVTLTDSDGSITTSDEYDLVLTDDSADPDETITVQVNVYGVAPSNNPLQKDGAALASLTNVEIRVSTGAALSGSQLFYSGTATTDASGNLGNIDLSATAAADTDPVLLSIRTAAGDSIIAAEIVGLI